MYYTCVSVDLILILLYIFCMNINKIKADLESQGFEGNLEESDDINYFTFGIGLRDGEIPIYMMAKVMEDVLYVSTINMIEDATAKDLAYFMSLNDLMVTGKLFLSTEINDIEVLNDSKTKLTIDYGFEILGAYYSNEMLWDYIQQMYKNLESLVFAEE